jgi:hypothetical protein
MKEIQMDLDSELESLIAPLAAREGLSVPEYLDRHGRELVAEWLRADTQKTKLQRWARSFLRPAPR